MPTEFRPHSIGGQALVEGVMMRSPRWWAVAVRRPEGGIHVESHTVPNRSDTAARVPLLRGALTLADAMSVGVRALAISSRHSSGEDTTKDVTPAEIRSALAIAFSVFAGIFVVVPALVVPGGEARLVATEAADIRLNLVEGLLRIGIFAGYIGFVSRLAHVRRVFQYHGAEHKVIASVESGGEPTVDTTKRHPKEHVRCGTNFLALTVIVTTVVFAFAGRDPWWLRIAERLVLLPVVAAVSYEILRAGARSPKSPLVRLISAPGLALQRITTREPDDDQIEVALAAMTELRARERDTH